MKESIKWWLQRTFISNKNKLFSIIFYSLLLLSSFAQIGFIAVDYKLKNYNQIYHNKLDPYIDISGIDSTTIDHRVVDINLDSWLQDKVISADELDGYKTIKTESFYLYGKNIEEVILPNSINTIEIGAFSEARRSIKKFFIPASVTNINGNIFFNTEVAELVFEKGSKYSIEDACVYDNDQQKLLFVLPNYIKNNTIRIKPNTKIIAPYAFSNLFLAGIYNSFDIVQSDFNNVVEIQDNAFYGANIKNFIISNNVRSIGEAAFSGFIGELSSNHPNFVLDKYNKFDVLVDKNNDIGMAMVNVKWTSNENLNDLTFNYQYIGKSFKGNHNSLNLNNLIFGDKVKEIHDDAFNNLNLNKIQFVGKNITRIGNISFSNINNQIGVGSKNFTISFPDSVKYIGEAVFYNSSSGIVDIPASVSHIGTGINLNSWKININLDPSNQWYEMQNGLLVEKNTKSIIGYDYDWLLDANNDGKFIVNEQIKYIQPRSLSMLMMNPNFKGIEIKNPDIIVGNGAFLNTGVNTSGAKLDLIVPDQMPLETKRYIVTQVMSWEFGNIQDTNLTKYGGGSWRGTVNGKSDIPPIPKPDPFPPPANNTTNVKFEVPPEFYNFLPSALNGIDINYFKQWFTIINGSNNPKTEIIIKEINVNNLNGIVQLTVELKNALTNNQISDSVIKKIDIDGFKKSTMTKMVQINVPNPKIDIPNMKELEKYINWENTGNVINHDFYKYNLNAPVTEIKSRFSVEEILNTKTSTGYLNNFFDNKLHVSIRVDNYYDQKGNFVHENFINYKPLYIKIKLDGFNLIETKIKQYEGNDFDFWIIIIIIGLILLAMIIAIISMNYKRKKK